MSSSQITSDLSPEILLQDVQQQSLHQQHNSLHLLRNSDFCVFLKEPFLKSALGTELELWICWFALPDIVPEEELHEWTIYEDQKFN